MARKKAAAKKKTAKQKKFEKGIESKTKKGIACSIGSHCKCKHGGCAYFLGFLGALIYYVSTATGFWGVVLGVLKSIVWPVFIVHGLLKFLGL